MSNPRQAKPQPKHDPQTRQDNGLQDLHTLRLRQHTDRKRQNRRAAPAKRRREPDGAHMQVPRQQLRRRNHDSREERTQEEALQRDGDGGHVELRDEPEEQLQPHGDGDVDGDGELDAELGGDEAEQGAAEGDAEPEADGGHARVEGVGLADLDHELHDPAAEGDLDADVGEEEDGAEPGDAGVGALEEGGAHGAVAAAAVGGGGVCLGDGLAVDGAGLGPEGGGAPDELDDGHAELCVCLLALGGTETERVKHTRT